MKLKDNSDISDIHSADKLLALGDIKNNTKDSILNTLNGSYPIDYYIQQSNDMKNSSHGGSACYHFGDVVLVKYTGYLQYNTKTREGAEEIAVIANQKNENGVRTPKHLDIKRVIDGNQVLCWVLQETAKGENFTVYCRNKDTVLQLKMQKKLADAPESHYEKLVNDIVELFNLGIELKAKNIFYDENIENGGFTIIDLLGKRGSSFNNSIKDILTLKSYLFSIVNQMGISYYNNDVDEIDRDISTQQLLKIRKKIFQAMEKIIPNFENHRRNILRSMTPIELEYLDKNGVFIDNLILTEQEEKQFEETIDTIVNTCIEKIRNCEYEYWQIKANKIRNDLPSFGLQNNWKFHKKNHILKKDFENYYDYNRASENSLKTIVENKFDAELEKNEI